MVYRGVLKGGFVELKGVVALPDGTTVQDPLPDRQQLLNGEVHPVFRRSALAAHTGIEELATNIDYHPAIKPEGHPKASTLGTGPSSNDGFVLEWFGGPTIFLTWLEQGLPQTVASDIDAMKAVDRAESSLPAFVREFYDTVAGGLLDESPEAQAILNGPDISWHWPQGGSSQQTSPASPPDAPVAPK